MIYVAQSFSEVTGIILCAAGGKDLLFSLDEEGQTCLHLACKTGYDSVVSLLVSEGGEELCGIKDKEGRVAADIATREEVLQALTAAI